METDDVDYALPDATLIVNDQMIVSNSNFVVDLET